ncbi:MAG: tyrosine-type recombinase/integrase [Terriglobales bacterium]
MKLSQAIDFYVRRKQDAGARFNAPKKQLRSLLRHCGDIDLHRVKLPQVTSFIDGSGVRPSTWCQKRGTLKAFFEYWALRGRLKAPPPLPPRAPKSAQTFVPYIYSQSDLRLLLDAVPQCQRVSSCVMSGATFRTLLLFLYGTGMRLGEALRLRLMDVDLRVGLVTIRGTKFYKSRLVPLGRDVRKLLQQYLEMPARQNQHYRPLFQTKRCNPIRLQVVDKSFSRLRRIAGIARHDKSSYQPRLHDLRHSFAVHRVTAWYRQNKDVQLLLPALSTYLGHVDLSATQRYLTMTPELLEQANRRFEQYVCGGADER